MKLRHYQETLISDARAKLRELSQTVKHRKPRLIMQLGCGGGKCLGADTPILMHDGSIKPVQDVLVGDVLMGPDGGPRNVLSLASGMDDMYLVIPTKGEPYSVNSRHIISLKKQPLSSSRVTGSRRTDFTGGSIVNINVLDFVSSSKKFKSRHRGWRAPANFGSEDVGVDPYFLGLWIGDGTLSSTDITTGDIEIKDYMSRFADSLSMSYRELYNSDNSVIIRITTAAGKPNPVRRKLAQLGILKNKHIPMSVIRSSEEDRLSFLAGYIDADGSHNGRGGIDVISKSKDISDGIAFIVRSLGMACYPKKVSKKCCNNGVVGEYYRMTISGDTHRIPCKIERKKPKERAINKSVLSTSIRVERIGYGEYYGFEIDGDHLFMLGDFTVTHNTFLAASMAQSAISKGGSAAFLCHRDFLADQASATFKDLDIDHSFIANGRWLNPWTNCHIGMIGSMKSRMGSVKAPSLCFVDECFPAGTDVDGRPIETIQVGDEVSSVNHVTGVIEKKRVTRLYSSTSNDLVVVKTKSREIICTSNHPFFCLGKGYVNASDIEGETIAVVHDLRGYVRGGQKSIVQNEASWKVLLLEGLLEGVLFDDFICDNGANQQGARLRAHEIQKSYGINGSKAQDERNSHQDGAQTCCEGRERDGSNQATDGACRNDSPQQCGSGVCLCDEGWSTVPQSLQNRYSHTRCNDCHRGGRSVASLSGEKKARQEKRGPIAFERVESVQVLQCGSDGETPVFNIEVDGNNNYFANGILVHNCHHSVAKTWNAVLDAWPETTFILLSATPGMRTDGKGLEAVADGIVCGPSNAQLISEGALSDYEWYAPTEPDMSNLHVRMGEYIQSEAAAEMSKAAIIGDLVKSYKKHADGAMAVYFAQTVDTSRLYAHAFNEAGIPAAHLDADSTSEERKRIILKAATGEIKVIFNVGLFGEGFDMAAMAGRPVTVEAVGICRITKSFPLLVQMAMRSMRAKDYPGIILDHAGAYKEHNWLPDDEVEWTLQGAQKPKQEIGIRQCQNCGAALRRGAMVCNHCGFANALTKEGPSERAGPAHIDGDLAKIDKDAARAAKEAAMAELKVKRGGARTLEELEALEKEMGYKRGWAKHIFNARKRGG